MLLHRKDFIKTNKEFHFEYTGFNIAPMFRKKFIVTEIKNAKLYVCGLGYGYYYINGKKVTEDLFISPVSDYNKTLWYNVYDVEKLLKEGENVVSVILGNGWYNEEVKTTWGQQTAPWRDNPKFVLALEIDGNIVLKTDETWKCKADSAVYFNGLRSGEYFDARKYEENWCQADYDDSAWDNAVEDNNPPMGMFRECVCEPIKETQIFETKNITKIDEETYVFDIGQNISGYVRMTVTGNKGDELIIKYDEELSDDLNLRNKMDEFYFEGEFHTDKFICSGKKMTWSPKFTYHGFRYITISGIKNIDDIKVQGVFVHQDIKRKTTFECSDKLLNKMFEAGVISCWSNMFYMLTDCPTREKYGWMNDAQSSCEQMLTNFKIDKLLIKWLQDIYDAMREDGKLPGIVPTGGWGYDWGNGPVSDGNLFEIPLRVYMHTGESKYLINSLEYFERYFVMLDANRDDKGFVNFGLDDWTYPGDVKRTTAGFINAVLEYEFSGIAELSAKLKGVDGSKYKLRADKLRKLISETFITDKECCTIEEQSAVAMLIYYGLYEDLEPLKNQLAKLVEIENNHHKCGMVGMRRLLLALNKCGLENLAYKILTAEGYPGYKVWFDRGATTLWEIWDEKHLESKNHHMYSDFMSWIIKTLVGLQLDSEKLGEKEFVFNPKFIDGIDFVKGSYTTDCGDVTVEWKKENDKVCVKVYKPEKLVLKYKGTCLRDGINNFEI